MEIKTYYRIYVTKDNDCTADVGIPARIYKTERTSELDQQYLDEAFELANTLTVGSDGKAEFDHYCIYVTYGDRITADLVGTAVRCYSSDRSEDYTVAKGHGGNVRGYWRQSNAEV